MSTRPYSPLPVVDTSILRTRPAAAPISNPISLVEPVLPEVPVKAKEFDEAQIPDGLEPSLQTFSASLQLAGELAIANGLAQNGVSGLYGRSSKIQQAVSAATTSYMTALGETYGRLNDAARSAGLDFLLLLLGPVDLVEMLL